MATHGMHNTTISKPLVVQRVACVLPVYHKEDSKSDELDEGVEHHNGVGEVCGCHETMVCWSSLWGHPVSPPSIHTCGCTMVVCGLRCVTVHTLPMVCVLWLKAIGGTCGWLHGFAIHMCASLVFITNGTHHACPLSVAQHLLDGTRTW